MKKLFFSICIISCSIHVAAQCNNTIYPTGHDKAGRPTYYWPYNMRPATECELEFFRKFHPYLISALLKTEDYYSNNNWTIQSPDKTLGEIDEMFHLNTDDRIFNKSLDVYQGSEKTFFTLIELGYFDWNFKNPALDENTNPEVRSLATSMINLLSDGVTKNTDPQLLKLQMQLNDIDSKRNISISIPNVNLAKDSLQEEKSKIELIQVNGAAFAVKIIRDKKLLYGFNDGENVDNDNHLDELHIYIGKWKTPQILNTDNSQTLLVKNNFNVSQPKLSLQNFMIVIKTDASNFEEIIANMNFEKLNKLIMQ